MNRTSYRTHPLRQCALFGFVALAMLLLVSSLPSAARNGVRAAALTNSGAIVQPGLISQPGCIPPPAGLVSWWPMDFSLLDSVDGNNPADVGGVGFGAGKVAAGVTFTTGGFIEIPDSANLRLQKFTLDAWVRPDGSGPTKDEFGSVIIAKNVEPGNQSAGLLWSATHNHFTFIFGDIRTERIVSQKTFAAGQFYHVAGTYDGSTFRLYVNGQLEGEKTMTKPIKYSSIPWAIGGSASFARKAYPRTWNGVIDEVEIFNRALDVSEIQAIFNADSAGKCKKAC